MNHKERPIGWTTIDEAKRLVAAQVDLNSADMNYVGGPFTWTLSAVPSIAVKNNLFSFRQGYEWPCWSLGALLQLIPKQIVLYGVTFYLVVIANEKSQWSICYANPDCIEPFFSFEKETLVEACIEMIAALKVAEKEEKAIVLWPNVKEEGGAQ
jgi:hypothetical protein